MTFGKYSVDEVLEMSRDYESVIDSIKHFNTYDYKIKWDEFNVCDNLKNMKICHIVNKTTGKDKNGKYIVACNMGIVTFIDQFNTNLMHGFTEKIKVYSSVGHIHVGYHNKSFQPVLERTIKYTNGYLVDHFDFHHVYSPWFKKRGISAYQFKDDEIAQQIFLMESSCYATV
jgi:hypothetical protein